MRLTERKEFNGKIIETTQYSATLSLKIGIRILQVFLQPSGLNAESVNSMFGKLVHEISSVSSGKKDLMNADIDISGIYNLVSGIIQKLDPDVFIALLKDMFQNTELIEPGKKFNLKNHFDHVFDEIFSGDGLAQMIKIAIFVVGANYKNFLGGILRSSELQPMANEIQA